MPSCVLLMFYHQMHNFATNVNDNVRYTKSNRSISLSYFTLYMNKIIRKKFFRIEPVEGTFSGKYSYIRSTSIRMQIVFV